MAGSQFINATYVVAGPADRVTQAYAAGLAGTGFTYTVSGNTIIVTRRYTPTWAIVVGVVGLLFFLIGAFAFLVKDTETLTITLTPEGSMTRVGVHGVASEPIRWRIDGVTRSLGAPSSGEQADAWFVARGDERFGPITGHELRRWISDGRVVPDDLCWGPGSSQWLSAREHPGLRAYA